jgi:hypothetical protein
VKDHEGISPGKPTVKVALGVILQVKLLKDVKVREGEDNVYTDEMNPVNVEVPPNFEGKFHASQDNKSRLSEVEESEQEARPKLSNHGKQKGEAENGSYGKVRDEGG